MATKGRARVRPWLWAAALGLALAALAFLAGRATAQVRETGLSGKVEVRQVEVGYRLAGNSMKVRVHLISGLALDYDTKDETDIDRILEMTRIFAVGRARMFAEMEGTALQAIDLSVP